MEARFIISFAFVMISFLPNIQAKQVGCQEMNDTLDAILFQQIPELQSFGPYIEGLSKGEAHAMIMNRSCPDPNAKDTIDRDYYEMYVGEDHDDHTVRIYGIFINKDLKHILVYDAVDDSYTPLEKVRQTKKWKRDWARRKRWVEKHGK